jgi:NAD(P)-dependent dehydrogenase (short-subunit alcohol dehydrogenase family)
MVTPVPFSLSGKTALVTGASGGLGQHFARVLSHAGANVVAVARRTDRLDALSNELGDKALALELDVADPDAMDGVLDAAETRFGPVNILINNAGISIDGPSLELTGGQLDQILDVNVKSIWHLSTRIARRLVATKSPGSIVNIASIYGLNTAPTLSLYATSKAAVVQLSKSLALDFWPDGIRVNALCPGYFRSEMNADFFDTEAGKALIRRIPPRRLGQYHELDGALLLLASDASSFMTGTAIPVDGGHTAQLA